MIACCPIRTPTLMFFALHKASGTGSAFLDTDYSFDDVEDPMIMGRTEVVPPDFMKFFRLSLVPGRLEDSVRNDIWYLLSPRVIAVLKEARNAKDLDIIPLPVQFQTKHPEVKGYCAFGVRRQLECIDKAASDVAWAMVLVAPDFDSLGEAILANAKWETEDQQD